MIEKNRNLTLSFKRSKSTILFGFENFDRRYLENGTRLRDGVHRSQIGSHIWAFEWYKKFRPQITSRGQRSRSNLRNVEVENIENGSR